MLKPTNLTGQRVFVYKNLHKKCWSVRALKGPSKGRVIAHVETLDLQDCEFRVQLGGRARAIATRRRNVHAGIVGTVGPGPDGGPHTYQGVTYNPFRDETFIHIGTFPSRPIKTAQYVWLDKDRAYYWPETPYELSSRIFHIEET